MRKVRTWARKRSSEPVTPEAGSPEDSWRATAAAPRRLEASGGIAGIAGFVLGPEIIPIERVRSPQ